MAAVAAAAAAAAATAAGPNGAEERTIWATQRERELLNGKEGKKSIFHVSLVPHAQISPSLFPDQYCTYRT